MQDLNIKNIRFPVETDRQLVSLAGKLGRTKLTVFKQMTEYFYRTKKDPLDINDELLKKTITKGQQHLAGFIKVQEQTLLIPMKDDMVRMIGSQKKILDCFNNQILAYNRQSEKQLAVIIEQLGQADKIREQMRSRFLYILDTLGNSEAIRKAKEQVKQI